MWLKQIGHIEKREPDTAEQRYRNFHEDRSHPRSKYDQYFTNVRCRYSKDPCLVTVVSWLQENSTLYFENQESHSNSENKEEIEASPQTFTRYWIYSHHIYSNVSLYGELKLEIYFTILDKKKKHARSRL